MLTLQDYLGSSEALEAFPFSTSFCTIPEFAVNSDSSKTGKVKM
jgi:hypothetical protein